MESYLSNISIGVSKNRLIIFPRLNNSTPYFIVDFKEEIVYYSIGLDAGMIRNYLNEAKINWDIFPFDKWSDDGCEINNLINNIYKEKGDIIFESEDRKDLIIFGKYLVVYSGLFSRINLREFERILYYNFGNDVRYYVIY